MSLTYVQGPVYTLDMSEEGYSSGGKDGVAKFWDPDFKPITSVNLVNAPEGYKGIVVGSVLNLFVTL